MGMVTDEGGSRRDSGGAFPDEADENIGEELEEGIKEHGHYWWHENSRRVGVG